MSEYGTYAFMFGLIYKVGLLYINIEFIRDLNEFD